MTILRDITNDKHRQVEQTDLIQYMFNGQISEEFYKMYLSELFHIYNQLEKCGEAFNLFDKLEGLRRSDFILSDIQELGGVILEPVTATKEYLEYLKKLNSTQVMAHIYVRHMGDLYGGKMLAHLTLRGRLRLSPNYTI
jgi:heme oxygenase